MAPGVPSAFCPLVREGEALRDLPHPGRWPLRDAQPHPLPLRPGCYGGDMLADVFLRRVCTFLQSHLKGQQPTATCRQHALPLLDWEQLTGLRSEDRSIWCVRGPSGRRARPPIVAEVTP